MEMEMKKATPAMVMPKLQFYKIKSLLFLLALTKIEHWLLDQCRYKFLFLSKMEPKLGPLLKNSGNYTQNRKLMRLFTKILLLIGMHFLAKNTILKSRKFLLNQ